MTWATVRCGPRSCALPIQPEQKKKRLQAGSLELNAETHQVTIHGQEMKLTPVEFDLLRLMIEHPGQVFPRTELISLGQGYDFEGYERTVDSYIKNLRRKIAAVLPDQEVIGSVHGVGYKLKVHQE